MTPGDRPTVEALRARHAEEKRRSAALVRSVRRLIAQQLVTEILQRRGWGRLPER